MENKNKYEFVDEKGEHLHLLNGKPLTGTSSIEAVLSKPLTWWAAGKACETLGWINSKIRIDGKYVEVPLTERIKNAEPKLEELKKMSVEEYIQLLDKAYCAHKDSLKRSAKKGTDLHAELEKFVKSEMGKKKYEDTDLDPQIKPFIDWSRKNVKHYIASEAHCYSERLWVGGKMDAIAELNNGIMAVIDFKSSKEAYISQFIQAAGYAIQIDENGLFDNKGKYNKKLEKQISALIIVPFGAKEVVPEIRESVEEYKKGFEAAVLLYRLMGFEDRIKN